MRRSGRVRVRRELSTKNRLRTTKAKLVAETGADGDLVTALGTATAEDGGTSLGLHAGKEAVGLGAVATVGLKGTLWHGTLYSCAGSS